MKFPNILAHRGANKKAPENTITAFQLALAEGADGIELDVQFSKDGELMVIHDEKLDRTTDMKGLVCSYTASQINQANASVLHGEEFACERVPRLRQVFELLKGTGKILNIELKTGVILYKGIEQKVIDMIREYGYEELTIISSFNHYSLATCKAIAPDIKTGILYMSGLYKPWDYAATLKADALHPLYFNILNADNEQLHGFISSGLQINPFTVNNESDIEAMIQKGVTSIITDVPDKIIKMKENH